MILRDTDDRFDRYRELLDVRTGSTAYRISEVEPRERGDGRIFATSYLGTPEPGYITGFTYGLSLVEHPAWGGRGRELAVTVRSDDIEWTRIPARVAAALRGFGSFEPGHVLGSAEPYVESSKMSSAVLEAPSVEVASGVLDLNCRAAAAPGEHDLIEIIGFYPIYSTEREFIQRQGVAEFWNLEWDRFDPGREPVVR